MTLLGLPGHQKPDFLKFGHRHEHSEFRATTYPFVLPTTRIAATSSSNSAPWSQIVFSGRARKFLPPPYPHSPPSLSLPALWPRALPTSLVVSARPNRSSHSSRRTPPPGPPFFSPRFPPWSAAVVREGVAQARLPQRSSTHRPSSHGRRRSGKVAAAAPTVSAHGLRALASLSVPSSSFSQLGAKASQAKYAKHTTWR